jgi:uncharacterized protein YndB with AHSA1/START domain
MALAVGTTKLTMHSDREIRIERIFDAPRDRVWRAFTEPDLVAQWWGRGHQLDVERDEVRPGGHWRYVEHGPEGLSGFEGRYREVSPPQRIVRTFEWDGMPGYVSIEDATFEDIGEGHTKLTAVVQLFSPEERDGMLGSGMEEGMNQSYAALDNLLASQALTHDLPLLP